MIDQFFDKFGNTGGVLLIIGIGILFFLIVAFILERQTRKKFPERPKSADDEDFFDFDDDDN